MFLPKIQIYKTQNETQIKKSEPKQKRARGEDEDLNPKNQQNPKLKNLNRNKLNGKMKI